MPLASAGASWSLLGSFVWNHHQARSLRGQCVYSRLPARPPATGRATCRRRGERSGRRCRPSPGMPGEQRHQSSDSGTNQPNGDVLEIDDTGRGRHHRGKHCGQGEHTGDHTSPFAARSHAWSPSAIAHHVTSARHAAVALAAFRSSKWAENSPHSTAAIKARWSLATSDIRTLGMGASARHRGSRIGCRRA